MHDLISQIKGHPQKKFIKIGEMVAGRFGRKFMFWPNYRFIYFFSISNSSSACL